MTHIASNTTTETDNCQEAETSEMEITVIRHSQFVTVSWSDLTEAERRAIYEDLFDPCGINNL